MNSNAYSFIILFMLEMSFISTLFFAEVEFNATRLYIAFSAIVLCSFIFVFVQWCRGYRLSLLWINIPETIFMMSPLLVCAVWDDVPLTIMYGMWCIFFITVFSSVFNDIEEVDANPTSPASEDTSPV